MSFTTALFTSLSGMNTNSQAITVTGNNIANSNTEGFKSSRISFETHFSRSLSSGSAPTGELGGTNPTQIGLGTRVGSVRRNFNSGSLQPTGVNTDIAMEGNGFFILQSDSGTRYSRAGTFSLDRDFKLVNPDGAKVQGYSVDSEFKVIEGAVGDITIPIGSLTLAEATQKVRFAGNLNARGDKATVGTLITSDPIFSDSGATVSAVAADNLTGLFDSTGAQLFSLGDLITFTSVQKGGATLPKHTFEVGPTNTTQSDDNGDTLQSFFDFLEDVLGIDTAVSGGVTVSTRGAINIQGNTGTGNDIVIESGNIIVNQTTNPTLPLAFTKQNAADGESVRTTFIAFDSLGTAMTIDMTVVLEQKTDVGTSWRFYMQSVDDTDLDRVLGNGTIDFDTNGQLVASANAGFIIDRSNTGAFTPQQLTAEFTDSDGVVSALASSSSQILPVSLDGSAIGTLEDFSVFEDGSIVGVFSNSLQRTLAQVTVAQFANPEGLEEVGGNLYRVTVNSGNAAIVTSGTGGTGRMVGGALELSNVELSQEFIGLITASTGFTANARVLTTSDRLIQELLSIVR